MNKYIDLKNEISNSKIEEIAKIIKNGGIIVFPTETVYGIGANGLDSKAVEKIYEAKKRNKNKPLILLISDKEMLGKIAQDITPMEAKLMENFWPGPLTIILNKKISVPDIVTGGLDTVGVRMTSGKIAREIINLAGVPIAAPSANIAGKPSAKRVEDIYKDLEDNVDCIIDGGESEAKIESTIVKVIDEIPCILRLGKITAEEIKKVAGSVNIDRIILK